MNKTHWQGVRGLWLLVWLIAGLPLKAQQKVWTLNDCIAWAWKNNVVLNQQKLTSDITKVNYEQAKANRLPNLNFTDAETFNFGNTYLSGGSEEVKQNTSSNYPSLTSSVVLFGGGKYFNLIKENKLNFEASQLDVATQKNNLALSVTAAYVQVLYEYDAITTAQREIDADSVQVVRTAKYVEVGQSPEDSLYQIQAQLAATRAAKVGAENQLALANLQLEQLMELPVTKGFAVTRPADELTVADIAISAEDIYLLAEHTFPEIQSAALKTRAYETDVAVTRAALMPTLSLNAGLSTEYYSALSRINTQTIYQNQAIGYLQNNPSEIVMGPVPVSSVNSQHYPFFTQFGNNFSQLISLNLSVPIFNNYKARNNIKLARLAVENTRLNEQAVKNTLRKNVEQAYTDQLAAGKNFAATKEQLMAETRAYNDMQVKLRVGLASVTNYLIEENNYYKAVLANLQAKYEYLFKTKVLAFYTGTPLTQ